MLVFGVWQSSSKHGFEFRLQCHVRSATIWGGSNASGCGQVALLRHASHRQVPKGSRISTGACTIATLSSSFQTRTFAIDLLLELAELTAHARDEKPTHVAIAIAIAIATGFIFALTDGGDVGARFTS